MQFSVPLPPKSAITAYDLLALSPDGRYVAFTAAVPPGGNMLWLRPMDSSDARPIPGTEGAYLPFWSPDSRYVAFTSNGRLRKVGIAGSAPVTLCEGAAWGGAWSREGTIVMGSSTDSLRQVAETGGDPKPLLTLDASRQEIGQVWPQLLPDGKHFLFLSRSRKPEQGGVYCGQLGSTESKRILPGESMALFSPPGYLLFLRQETLLAQPFDASKLQTLGGAFGVADGIGKTAENSGGMFTVSAHGALAYRAGSSPNYVIAMFDRSGKRLGTVGPHGQYAQLTLSPDGRRLALERRDPRTDTYDIWTLELATGIMSRLTFDPADDRDPVWSPDGREIVFGSNRTGLMALYRKTVGGAQEQLLHKSDERETPEAWSKSGFILYGNLEGKKYRLLPVAGSGEPRVVLESEYTVDEPNISPDGKWVAYDSKETGRYEVYTAVFPDFTGRRQVSGTGGAQAHWAHDGKQLVYLDLEGKLMAVDVKASAGGLETGPPRPLFPTGIRSSGTTEQFTMSLDGSRFYFMELIQDEEKPITVILNWPARYRH